MLEAIANIERYSARGRDVFERSELLQNYFLRQLQIIGEAARALPGDIRALSSAIPWSSIIGMRSILVHGYFDIDTDVVWDAVVNDIPQLKPHVKAMLASLES
jgi:uncharacterized protein with HEPN domain